MKYFSYLFLLIALTLACTPQNQSKSGLDGSSLTEDSLLYAQNFKVERLGAHQLLTVKTPWKGAQKSFKFLLYPKGTKLPTIYPEAQKIAVPVERILCTSTVDVAFLDFLDATDKMVALANGNFTYHPEVRQALADGKIADLGSQGTIDYERALMAKPEIALLYSLGDLKNYDKLKSLGISSVLMADFMEEHPLGRAEWCLFVAHLLGKEKLAKQRFDAVVQAYQQLKLQARSYQKRPTVLTGAVFQGTWHVAGGGSLMAGFINDAHAQYLWADNQDLSGVPLDFEAVYSKALNADFWINISNFKRQGQMLQSEPLYADFSAFKSGQLFNYYKRSTKSGGTDVFESAIVAPHRLLGDLIHIFHAARIDTSSLYYYEQLTQK